MIQIKSLKRNVCILYSPAKRTHTKQERIKTRILTEWYCNNVFAKNCTRIVEETNIAAKWIIRNETSGNSKFRLTRCCLIRIEEISSGLGEWTEIKSSCEKENFYCIFLEYVCDSNLCEKHKDINRVVQSQLHNIKTKIYM